MFWGIFGLLSEYPAPLGLPQAAPPGAASLASPGTVGRSDFSSLPAVVRQAAAWAAARQAAARQAAALRGRENPGKACDGTTCRRPPEKVAISSFTPDHQFDTYIPPLYDNHNRLY